MSGAVDLSVPRMAAPWVIVDYKTDRGVDEPDVLRDRYALQGAAYAVAVERATGAHARLAEVVLVAARCRSALTRAYSPSTIALLALLWLAPRDRWPAARRRLKRLGDPKNDVPLKWPTVAARVSAGRGY